MKESISPLLYFDCESTYLSFFVIHRKTHVGFPSLHQCTAFSFFEISVKSLKWKHGRTLKTRYFEVNLLAS